jgi:hypothetical protein
MRERIIKAIARRLPWKQIGGECFKQRGPLMVRYMLLRTRWFNLYLHNFLRSDADRHCHDHPWSFCSLILTEWYVEHTPNGERRFKPGSVLYHPAEWLHWVEVAKPMWTLVLVFPKRREWGFLTERGWIRWQKYEHSFPGACDE